MHSVTCMTSKGGLDKWSNLELVLSHCQLIDVYMEAYQHVLSRESRRHLAQIMVNLMYQRPRIELSSSYFVLAYRYECAILRLKTSIMKYCLNTQVKQILFPTTYPSNRSNQDYDPHASPVGKISYSLHIHYFHAVLKFGS